MKIISILLQNKSNHQQIGILKSSTIMSAYYSVFFIFLVFGVVSSFEHASSFSSADIANVDSDLATRLQVEKKNNDLLRKGMNAFSKFAEVRSRTLSSEISEPDLHEDSAGDEINSVSMKLKQEKQQNHSIRQHMKTQAQRINDLRQSAMHRSRSV